jgi:hypothetical protein
MQGPKTEKPALAEASNRFQKMISGRGSSFQEIANTSAPQVTQTIHAQLLGVGICWACGITARAKAPVLALCRLLLKAGHDPESPLEVWRGDVLCLRAQSVGQAAQLTVDESRVRFARWKPFSTAAISPQIAREG